MARSNHEAGKRSDRKEKLFIQFPIPIAIPIRIAISIPIAIPIAKAAEATVWWYVVLIAHIMKEQQIGQFNLSKYLLFRDQN